MAKDAKLPVVITFEHPTLPHDAKPDVIRYLREQQVQLDKFVARTNTILASVYTPPVKET